MTRVNTVSGDDILGTSGRWCLHLHLVVGVPEVRGLPLYCAARDVPVVRAIAVLKIFAMLTKIFFKII